MANITATDPPGASARPSEINAVPDGIDPWATVVWDFVLRERGAWERSGKSEIFTVSTDRILQAVGAPAGKAKRRADVNRLCRLLRAKGLVYRRERIFADGAPVYVGDTAQQLREYHFRWP
jgi:hypothetical protein